MNNKETNVEQAGSRTDASTALIVDARSRQVRTSSSDPVRRPRRAAPGQSQGVLEMGDWVPPELKGEFRTSIGASIVEELVAGHDASDVLRELVQNEFDAGGSQISVTFGTAALTISGNGNPIDASGWSRLDVILGTGRVIGGEVGASVAAKQNGIGSKNFGLRSLFLFGDRIYVRSGGRMAVLDLPSLGTQRATDPASRRRRGISIHVPYRTEAFHTLVPFTVERESETLDHMAGGLLATLVKLALVGRKPGIRELLLRSKRTNRELSWRQTAELVRCKMPGVSAIQRIGRLTDRNGDTGEPGRRTNYEEIEFVRAAPIPIEHSHQAYPTYYRTRAGSLKVCVSLPVRRKRIDTSRPGDFYYPLRTAHGTTGSAISVSAPFKLDADRTELLSNSWNRWLSLQAADLVVDLLTGDWASRFGADAYMAVLPIARATPVDFEDAVRSHLREQACWPTQATGTRNAWARASAIVVAASSELRGFLDSGQYLAEHLSEKKAIADLAQQCGARAFTLNSLVRLRCGPKDAKLATNLSEAEANYHFSDYTTSLSEVDRQRSMAAALTNLSHELSPANRKDLRLTASTLAGNGSLACPIDLVRVASAMWNVCPAPIESRLHPSLLGFRAIASLCKPFVIDIWLREAAVRAADGTIESDELEALYEHLMSKDLKLSPKALAVVRRSPVLKDHRGDWVAPEDMALLPASQAAVLEPILHAPGRDLARRPDLMRRLRIRRTLNGADLGRFAATVAEHPERAGPLEDLLKKNARLLMPKLVAALRKLAFLRSQSGAISRPDDLHLDNVGNRACLENGEAIVAGNNVALYRRLGCREYPSSDTLLAQLSSMRERGSAPLRPEIFYPVLVAALQAEKASVADLSGDPILWIDGDYRTPHDSLTGARIPRWFHGVAPVFRGSEAVRRAFEQLGASSVPREHHWIAFFRSLHERYPKDQPVARGERKVIHDAYQRRALVGLPAGMADDVRCLLSRGGVLYTTAQLRSGVLLEDDYPSLAEAMIKVGSKVGFADITDHTRSFYMSLGLQQLSAICGVPRLSAGSPTTPPGWFRPQHETDVLSLAHRQDFAIALSELAWAYQRRTPSFKALQLRDLKRSLASINRLAFVSQVTRVYRVAGQMASVPAEAAVFEDRIALLPARSKFELDQMLSHSLAELAGAVRMAHGRPLATSILPLLLCRTSEDFLAYLRRQGIQPPSWTEVDEDVIEPPVGEPTDPSAEAIIGQVLRGLASTMSQPLAGTSDVRSPYAPTPTPTSPPTPQVRPPLVLPPLDDVRVRVERRTGEGPSLRPTGGHGSGWRTTMWTPPSALDVERDRVVGERGEALAYRLEIERLRGMRYERPEDIVVWTSRTDATADHDIRSIAEDGKPLWIEVKSTMGVDGRFEWSRREFEKALRERDHYELWRIYEVHTATPTVKRFVDPASLLGKSELILELSSLRAFVEPKI